MPVVYLLLAIAAFLGLRTLYNSWTSPLNDIPGPYLARFSNLWRFIETWKGTYEQKLREQHRRYGDIVRTGPNIVSLSSPEAVDLVYSVKADLPKSDFYKVMQTYHNGRIVPTLLTVVDKRIHAQLRKPVANIFAMSTMRHFEPLVNETIHELIRILRSTTIERSTWGKTCSIDQWLSYYAFDSMSRLSFSRSFGFLEHGHDMEDILRNLGRNFKYCAIVGQMPWLDRFLWKNPLVRGLSKKSDPFSMRAGSLFRQRMAEQAQSSNDPLDKSDQDQRDIVSRILAVKKSHPDQVPDAAVIGYIMTILLAGSDTVSITLRTIVYHLAKNPSMQLRLQEEIEDANITSLPVSWSEAQDLPYLDAVVKEALRIHPPTAIFLERVVSEAGLTLPNGRVLPPGTIVSMNGWTVNQNVDVFGPNPNAFEPQRWLKKVAQRSSSPSLLAQSEKQVIHGEENEDAFRARVNRMSKADLAFGYGARSCLGRPVAYLEIYKFVPTLFALFKVRLTDPTREWSYKSYFVTEQHDMDVQLQWRGNEKVHLGVEKI